MGMKKKPRYEPKVRVYCENCHDWKDERFVELINIEEDISGRDRMTFKCPDCGAKNTSCRVG